jgi:hypothetical protein
MVAPPTFTVKFTPREVVTVEKVGAPSRPGGRSSREVLTVDAIGVTGRRCSQIAVRFG